jgi:hypothetical protein
MNKLPPGFRKFLHSTVDTALFLGGGAIKLSPFVTAAVLLTYCGDHSVTDPALQQRETAALKAKLDRLPTLRKYADEKAAQAAEFEVLPATALPQGTDPVKTRQQASDLSAAFKMAAVNAAVDVAHARNISLNDMLHFNTFIQLSTGQDAETLFNFRRMQPTSWLHLRSCQAEVMSMPGFVATEESAHRILSCADDKSRREIPYLLVGALSIGFAGIGGTILRNGLEKSIKSDEQLLQSQPVQEAAPVVQINVTPPQPVSIEAAIKAGISGSLTVRKPIRLKIA